MLRRGLRRNTATETDIHYRGSRWWRRRESGRLTEDHQHSWSWCTKCAIEYWSTTDHTSNILLCRHLFANQKCPLSKILPMFISQLCLLETRKSLKCEVSTNLLRQLTACPLLASCHRYPPRESRCPPCVWCRVDWCATNKHLCKHHIYRRLLMICNEQKPGENELRENGQKTGGKLGKVAEMWNVSKNIPLAFLFVTCSD